VLKDTLESRQINSLTTLYYNF